MSCLFYVLCIVCSLFCATSSAALPRTSYTYYLYSGLPSTWYNNNSVIMDGWKMRVVLLIQDYNRKIGFYCGFYSAGDSEFYSFSIVAVAGGVHDVVWSTKRGQFVREGASLSLARDAGLVLQDSNGNEVWLTPGTKSVAGMNLTEAGNFIVFGDEGSVLWQSFDNPLDTLLIGQKLNWGQNLVPNPSFPSRDVSPFSARLVSAANFSAFFNTSNGRYLMYYELGLDQNARNLFGLQYAEDGSVEQLGTSNASYPLEYIEFVKLGTDGHLKTYLYSSEGTDRNVSDLVTQQCRASPDRYLLTEVVDVTVSESNNADAAVASVRTVNDCKKACLRNCSCSAVVFRYENDASDGKCYMSSEIYLHDSKIAYPRKLYAFVKELNPYGAPSSPWAARHRKALAGMLAGGIASIIIISMCIVVLRKNNKDEDGDENLKEVPGIPLKFSYAMLQIATDNFRETLGSGGFGSVFKGVLADGTIIAVKRLDKLSQGMREFLAEVETIGSLHHFNLVRLVGFCAEKSCRLLVYEYLSNGSLDNWIFNRHKDLFLDWQTRKKIILDIAKGLTYLHEECRQKIIHLDIKPHNILLDENFNAKVSDFGLSTLIDRDESQVLTKMRGTPGYLAPEWKELRVTVKVDVYSFGIVLLEIVSKRRNVESMRSESSFHLLKMLQKKAEENRLIDIVEDLDEDMENNREEVVRMIRIGAWCLQDDPAKRPFMSTVVKVLEGLMEVDANISYKFHHAMVFDSIANSLVTCAPQASILSGPRP